MLPSTVIGIGSTRRISLMNIRADTVPLYGYAPAIGVPVVAFSVDTYWGEAITADRPWYGQRDQWVHRTINHQRPPDRRRATQPAAPRSRPR